MAEKKGSKKPHHPYRIIDDELKGGTLKSPLFFYGKERLLIDWAIKAIVNKYVNPITKEMDFDKNDASDLNFSKIVDKCETLPIMSEKRVVLVENFTPLKGDKLKSFNDDEVSLLAGYFSEVPRSCILIITGYAADKRLKLYRSLEKYGGSYDFGQLDEKTLVAWIEKQLRISGKTSEPSVISQMIDLSGYYDKDSDYTLYNMANDLRKAIDHSNGKEVKIEDITETISSNLLTDVFYMMDCMSKGNKGEALSMLHNLKVTGQKEPALLGLICSQLEIMLSVKEMRKDGKTLAEMEKVLGVHGFRIKKGLELANKYEMKHLQEILIKAYDIDKNVKIGVLDWWMAFELLIAEM